MLEHFLAGEVPIRDFFYPFGPFLILSMLTPYLLLGRTLAGISLFAIVAEAVALFFFLKCTSLLEKRGELDRSWLKPDGYASHVIDFGAHHLSPFWNGHWAYSDSQWRLVRGRREFLLNREPLSTHLNCAEKSGFEVMQIFRNYDDHGLSQCLLTPRFQQLSTDDRRTRGAILILRKCG